MNKTPRTLCLVLLEIGLIILAVKIFGLSPSSAFWIIIGQGVIFGMLNGGNDLANAIAASVATRALGVTAAVSVASLFNFAGTLSGEAVAKTIAKGIVPPELLSAQIAIAGVGGAIISSSIATMRGIPISITHSLVGGIFGAGLGAGLIANGNPTKNIAWDPFVLDALISIVFAFAVGGVAGYMLGRNKGRGIEYSLIGCIAITGLTATALFAFLLVSDSHIKLTKIILGISLAPFWSMLIGGLILRVSDSAIQALFANSRQWKVNQWLRRLQWPASAWLSFTHGLNDGQNIVAIFLLASIVGGLSETGEIVLWMQLAAAGAMAGGTILLGLPVLRTTSSEMIKKMDPIDGVSAQIAAAFIIYVHSIKNFIGLNIGGIPISTTHASVAAMMGTAVVKKISYLSVNVTGKILASWVITIPFAAFWGMLLLVIFNLLKL